MSDRDTKDVVRGEAGAKNLSSEFKLDFSSSSKSRKFSVSGRFRADEVKVMFIGIVALAFVIEILWLIFGG